MNKFRILPRKALLCVVSIVLTLTLLAMNPSEDLRIYADATGIHYGKRINTASQIDSHLKDR